ncbi:MAG TPA: hypothetical protein VHJ76_05515 [Actinomycetota bacterium]|nr:hypothetical protein [Actinomycetota bacterium]
MPSDERRKRNESTSVWMAEHPLAAWILYAFVFVVVSLLFELPDEDGVQWARVATFGPAIAGGLVAGSVLKHRRRNRRKSNTR